MTEESQTTKVVEETKSVEDEQMELAAASDNASSSITKEEEEVTEAPMELAAASDNASRSITKEEEEVTEAPTLREFFGIPETASDQGDDQWKAFTQKLAEETRGIKWTAAMPDLGSKIGELLDIKIHDILLTAWKKVEAVRQALEDSKQTPDKASYLDLTEHSIDYETKPFIDVKIKSASVKKLTLTVAINLKVKVFVLKVQNGAIRELQAGKCEGKGTIKYEKLSIAEKKFEPIKFPVSIEIPTSIPIPQPEAETAADEIVTAEEEDSKSAEELERIEL